jgi:hypothetical protein
MPRPQDGPRSTKTVLHCDHARCSDRLLRLLWDTGSVDIDPDGEVVLLIAEEAVEDDTWERRDRRRVTR